MRKLVTIFIIVHALVTIAKCSNSKSVNDNYAQLEEIDRRLKQIEGDSPNDQKVLTNEKQIRQDQTQKIVTGIKKLMEQKRRKLQQQGTQENPDGLDGFFQALDNVLNVIPKKMGISTKTRGQKAASIIGQGLLFKGVTASRANRKQHAIMMSELTTKMKARELYINSVDKNRAALQSISERLGTEGDYFDQKKSTILKFFNNMINYSE